MASTVRCGTSARSLTASTEIFGLSTEWTLIDAPLFCTREGQPHMLELKHSLRAYRTHIFDSVLITDIIRTLNCVIHMPAPIIVGISTGNSTGNTTLG